jgi:adenylate cyclase
VRKLGCGIRLLPFIICVLVIVLYYVQPGLLESFENRTYDMRFKIRGPLLPDERIAIIAIDEKSIGELGRFPWSRDRFSRMVRYVSEAGAHTLIMDVFFSEDESPETDGDFAASVRDSGITTLAAAFELAPDGTPTDMTSNIPLIESGARRVAHINVTPDPDGVIRWTPLVMRYGGKTYPLIALAAAMDERGVEEIGVGEYEVRIGGEGIRTDRFGRMLINYTGPPGLYERFSFSDVMMGRIPAGKLKDRILFVGATAIGIYDLRVSPFSNNAPGVEINAAIADNVLRRGFITRGGQEALIDLLLILTLGLAVSHVTLWLKASRALPLSIAVLAGHLGLSYYAFLSGRWISMVYPTLSILLSYSVMAYLRFFVLERKAKEIRTMFSSFVSKKVVDELMKEPERAKIGGDNKVITVLFADVKGYTSYSEKRRPEEVLKTLNEYLAEMTSVIMQYDGTLDKFMGDGIMAFWGAPLEQEDHAELAARCSLEMLSRLKGLHAKWESEGTEPLDCGIGLNSGEVIVGNIGAEGKKMEYTAIGDSVNLTSRIQGLSRDYHNPIIVTESFRRRVSHIAETEPLGEVTVKGKEAPIKIYTLKGVREH